MGILNYVPILREASPRLVLRHIRSSGSVCRATIARQTGLHPSTISRIVSSLIDEGLVQEDGEGSGEVGRKPIMLSLVPDAIHVIGIAIEPSFITGILVDLEANIVERLELDFQTPDLQTIMRKINLVIDKLLAEARKRGIEIVGIGVAMHGIIDSNKGISVFAPAFNAKDIPIVDVIKERYKIPVRVDNNANAMVLGESWFGNGCGTDNLLAVKIGKSIGSGILLNGDLFRGSDYSAGEVGHITVVFDGSLCKCGNYGCLETVASIDAVVRKGRLALKRGEGSELLRFVNSNPDKLDFNKLCEAARAGDKLALQLWEETGTYLGIALANAVNILNPSKVLIGGDILPALDFVLPKIREIVSTRAFTTLKMRTTIEEVGLGFNSVTVGAATLIFRELFEI